MVVDIAGLVIKGLDGWVEIVVGLQPMTNQRFPLKEHPGVFHKLGTAQKAVIGKHSPMHLHCYRLRQKSIFQRNLPPVREHN